MGIFCFIVENFMLFNNKSMHYKLDAAKYDLIFKVGVGI